ncbi:MAG: glycosyltransferase [Bacteroidales bacterium]
MKINNRIKPIIRSPLHKIGYNYDRNYINSGVLLMNLKALREMDIKKMINEYVDIYRNQLCWGDQDIINSVFPKILILDPRYNAISILWNLNSSKRGKLWSVEQIKIAGTTPVIIHYTTNKKPWKLGNAHVLKDRWYHYLCKTPFKDYDPKCEASADVNVTISNLKFFSKKIIKRIVLWKYRNNRIN